MYIVLLDISLHFWYVLDHASPRRHFSNYAVSMYIPRRMYYVFIIAMLLSTKTAKFKKWYGLLEFKWSTYIYLTLRKRGYITDVCLECHKFSSSQFTYWWAVHDVGSGHCVTFKQWVDIRQLRNLQFGNAKIMQMYHCPLQGNTSEVEYVYMCYYIFHTWANKSIVRRKRRDRSPSSIAQSIIISLQVNPEAQASTMPENWLSKQHDFCKQQTCSLWLYMLFPNVAKNIDLQLHCAFPEDVEESFVVRPKDWWLVSQYWKAHTYSCR